MNTNQGREEAPLDEGAPPGQPESATEESKSGRQALLRTLGDSRELAALSGKLCARLNRKLGLRSRDAQEIVHEGIATYLAIADRYPDDANHFGLLAGIVVRKGYESLRSQQRTKRVNSRYTDHLAANRPWVSRGEHPAGSTLDQVIRSENARLIQQTLDSLDDNARGVLLHLAEGPANARLELIKVSGVNKNTFDTRLRRLRLRLGQRLRIAGVLF